MTQKPGYPDRPSPRDKALDPQQATRRATSSKNRTGPGKGPAGFREYIY